MPTSTKKYLAKVAPKSDPNLEPNTQLEAPKELIKQAPPEIFPELKPKTIKTKPKKAPLIVVPAQNEAAIDQAHHRITKLEKVIKIRTNIVVTLVLIVVSANLIFIFLRPQNTTQSAAVSDSDLNQAATVDPKLKVLSQASVYTFENNPAIFDFGFKIDLKPDYIANINHPNCQTPIVPPTVNGCGFGLDLQKIGLPKSGLYYRSITLVTDTMSSSQKIQIDLKDYEKGQIAQNVGIVSSDPNSQKIILPSSISNGQSLYFRFWAPENVIKIKKIIIDYFSIADLKPVEINLATPFKGDQTGTIYLDIDGDGKFSQNIDKRWECTPTFPGVLPIRLKDQTSFKLISEDGCLTENTLPSPKSDLGSDALPAGKWLLVIDPQTVASFETKADTKSSSVDLKF